MSFSEKTVDALFSLFKANNFKFYLGTRFHFYNGKYVSTLGRFLKEIGSPNCFDTEALSSLATDLVFNRFPEKEFMAVVDRYSEQNKPLEEVLPQMNLEIGEVDLRDYISNLVPVIDASSKAKDNLLILDPNDRFKPVEIAPEVYFMVIGKDMAKVKKSSELQIVIMDFNPFTDKPVYIKKSAINGLPVRHINTYMPPAWRLRTGIKGQFRGFIQAVFEHLFPVKEELEYALDWFHHSLVSRCETILCLIGARGTGKGVVCSSIMEALHGTNYFQIAKQEVLTDKFNGEFKSKRYVFFDEVDVSGERELAKFKAFANNKIAMEKKGEDSQTIDNFASMAISSNYKNKFKVEAQERRFSVPTVTSTPLNSLYTEDEIGDFILRINDPDNDEIAEFGHFLLNRVPKYSAQTPLKGDYFMELCRLSMVEWKLFILEYILENGEADKPLLLKEMRRAFKRAFKEDTIFPSKQSAFETFLDDYKHNGKYKIGEYVRVKDENHRVCPAIMPNTEFITLFGYLTNPEQKDALDSL